VGSKDDMRSVFCNLLLSDQFSSGFLSPRFGAFSVLRMETAPRCMVGASVFSKEPPRLGEGPLIAVKMNVLRGVTQGIEYMGF